MSPYVYAFAGILLVQSAVVNAQTKHRVVLEVTAADASGWEGAARNVANLQRAFASEPTEIVVIAHGRGLGMLRRDSAGMQAHLQPLSKSGVQFLACENTMRRENVTKEQLFPFAATVDSGVAEIVRRAEKGWTQLKVGP